MSSHKQLVETYFDGFRRGDHQQILGCLTDDVTWYLAGYTTLHGKEAFDGEIENPDFEGRPRLSVDRLVEQGEVVVAIGAGDAMHRVNGTFRFAFCDAFTFAGDLIGVVESYVVPLGGVTPGPDTPWGEC